ncbi:MAG: nicotinamide riboside transporter PnuC [Bacteroidota bacterium]
MTELFGSFFGIAGVYLTVKKNIWCFPTGLANVALYGILFFNERLYADAILQIFYLILLVFGWTQWKKSSQQTHFIATGIEKEFWIILAIICIGSTMLLGTVFKNYTDASLPYLDSLLTSMSFIAQWMVAKKKLENWLVWIVADIVYVGMYIYKELYLTAGLYFVFIILAFIGYQEWKKKLAVNGSVA